MEAPYNNSLPTMDVQKRKPSAFRGIKKGIAYAWGVCGYIIGFCLLFTIIGIPFSILIWIGSMGIMAAANDKYQVSCPNCKKKTIVGNNQEDFKCRRCSQPIIINWIEHKK